MAERQIFVNFAVSDLKRSMDFFAGLGFSFNPDFTDENAACMVIGVGSYAMLLKRGFFSTFTKKEIADATKVVEVLTAVSLGSRDEVDAMFSQAIASGGRAGRDTEDLGFMYTRAFEDPDGHVWEPFFMDLSKLPQNG